MKRAIVSVGCGALFAVGLALSGMTLPGKITGFLDFVDGWDPSLAFVMGGALAVLLAAKALTPARPLLAPAYGTLPADRIDRRLAGGAALFGLGWGLSGYCPGPAVVSLGSGARAAWFFVPAMLAGILLARWVEGRFRVVAQAPDTEVCG